MAVSSDGEAARAAAAVENFVVVEENRVMSVAERGIA
jgi:hypothetical protein